MPRSRPLFLGWIVCVAVVSFPVAVRAEGQSDADAGAATTKTEAGKDKSDAEGETAEGKTADGKTGGEKKGGLDLTRLNISGYVNVGVDVTARPSAVPSDRLTYGLSSTVGGIIVTGTPYEQWKYTVHFGINPKALEVVTGVKIVDTNGVGTAQRTSATTESISPIGVEEVSIAYDVASWDEVKLGHFYMPFSPGASVLITSQMFPDRPEPTQVFMLGADQGLLNTMTWLDGRVNASVGVFNGSSLQLKIPGTSEIGPVYSFFADVHPLGKMPSSESDLVRGPLRFGLGMGALYRIGTLYDESGYQATRFKEIRVDAALRVALYGLFLQGEYLRRQQTDNLSLRPATNTGAYAQGSFYQPVAKVALAPLGRIGLSIENQDFAPRKIVSYQGGVAFYPRADLEEPDSLRIILEYAGERRLPENELAHSAVLHAQLKW